MLLIIINMGHTLIAVRGAVMGRNIALYGSMGLINEDLFGSSDYQTRVDFRLHKKSIKPINIIESNLFMQGINYDYNSLNITRSQEKARNNSFSYILYFGYEGLNLTYLESNNISISFLGSSSPCDKGIYCSMKRFSGITKNDENAFVYKLISLDNS